MYGERTRRKSHITTPVITQHLQNGDLTLFLAVAEYPVPSSCHRSIPAQDRRLAIRNCLAGL